MRYLAKVEDGENLGNPVVNAALTVELLDAISKMLCVRAQPAGAASRVTHAALNLYLRQLLRPFEVLGSFATPDKDPEGADASLGRGTTPRSLADWPPAAAQSPFRQQQPTVAHLPFQ